MIFRKKLTTTTRTAKAAALATLAPWLRLTNFLNSSQAESCLALTDRPSR